MSASSNCLDLIGRPYRLGGGDGTIDCIQMVYEVLKRLEIPTPTFRKSWYTDSRFTISRALLQWGERVEGTPYNGDVGITTDSSPVFLVACHNGVLYINRDLNAVAWCPIGKIPARWFRYCPTKNS